MGLGSPGINGALESGHRHWMSQASGQMAGGYWSRTDRRSSSVNLPSLLALGVIVTSSNRVALSSPWVKCRWVIAGTGRMWTEGMVNSQQGSPGMPASYGSHGTSYQIVGMSTNRRNWFRNTECICTMGNRGESIGGIGRIWSEQPPTARNVAQVLRPSVVLNKVTCGGAQFVDRILHL